MVSIPRYPALVFKMPQKNIASHWRQRAPNSRVFFLFEELFVNLTVRGFQTHLQ